MMSEYIKSLRELVGSRLILLPGVRAIVLNDRGEVLLQRRTDSGSWGLPAGGLDPEETALEALRREVLEETSLHVRRAEPMALYSGPTQRIQYPNGDRVQGFALAFIVREWEGQPCPDGEEGLELRFFDPARLPADMMPVHRRTIEDYRCFNGTFLVR